MLPDVAEVLLAGSRVGPVDVVEVLAQLLGLYDEPAGLFLVEADGFGPDDYVGAAVVAGEIPAVVSRG